MENFYWKSLIVLIWVIYLFFGNLLCIFEWGFYYWIRLGFMFIYKSIEVEYFYKKRDVSSSVEYKE